MSFNHKSRYNLRDYVFFNGLFAKMKYNNSIIGIVFPDNYFNSILEELLNSAVFQVSEIQFVNKLLSLIFK